MTKLLLKNLLRERGRENGSFPVAEAASIESFAFVSERWNRWVPKSASESTRLSEPREEGYVATLVGHVLKASENL